MNMDTSVWIAWGGFGVRILLNALASIYIARDIASNRKSGAPLFFPSYLWIAFALWSGLWAASLYWLVHHIKVNPKANQGGDGYDPET
jgi:hypothetical protein